MQTILIDVPVQITAGNSVAWRVSLSDYLASDGWVLSYALVNSGGKISITSVAEDDGHLVEIAAAVSADYKPGRYTWQAYATSVALAERYQADSGNLEILPNYSQQVVHDGRSHVQKVYENLKDIVEGKSIQGESSYAIGNRSIQKMPWEEVLVAYSRFRGMYFAEIRKENNKSNQIRVRF